MLTSDRFAVAHRVWFLLNSNCAKSWPASEGGRYNSHVSEETLLNVAQEGDGVKQGVQE